MPDDIIEINVYEENNVVIKSQKIEIKMIGNYEDKLYTTKDVKNNNKFSINTTMLKNMIESTIYFASKDESKPILTGNLFQLKNDNLNIVAIDEYRVALKMAKVNSNCKNM